MGITRPRPDRGVTRKAPGALDPAIFPFPSGCKIHYGHSRYEPNWFKLLKLVIYRTFGMFAVIPPPGYVFSAPFSL